MARVSHGGRPQRRSELMLSTTGAYFSPERSPPRGPPQRDSGIRDVPHADFFQIFKWQEDSEANSLTMVRAGYRASPA